VTIPQADGYSVTGPGCPECGGDRFDICTSWQGVYVSCATHGCYWSQAPDRGDVILSALETYRRNNPTPEAA